MAKKGTTGGPRARRVTEADLKRRSEYRSRAQRDRMWQRRVFIVTAVLIGLSVVALVYGLLSENVIRPREAISTVNGDEIATRDFESRVRLMRWLTAEQIREFYFLTGGNLEGDIIHSLDGTGFALIGLDYRPGFQCIGRHGSLHHEDNPSALRGSIRTA